MIGVSKMIDHLKVGIMLRNIAEKCQRWTDRQNVNKYLIVVTAYSAKRGLCGIEYSRSVLIIHQT